MRFDISKSDNKNIFPTNPCLLYFYFLTQKQIPNILPKTKGEKKKKERKKLPKCHVAGQDHSNRTVFSTQLGI